MLTVIDLILLHFLIVEQLPLADSAHLLIKLVLARVERLLVLVQARQDQAGLLPRVRALREERQVVQGRGYRAVRVCACLELLG
jgi:hypothetical protein